MLKNCTAALLCNCESTCLTFSISLSSFQRAAHQLQGQTGCTITFPLLFDQSCLILEGLIRLSSKGTNTRERLWISTGFSGSFPPLRVRLVNSGSVLSMPTTGRLRSSCSPPDWSRDPRPLRKGPSLVRHGDILTESCLSVELDGLGI